VCVCVRACSFYRKLTIWNLKVINESTYLFLRSPISGKGSFFFSENSHVSSVIRLWKVPLTRWHTYKVVQIRPGLVRLVYTQIKPVIFEPPCINHCVFKVKGSFRGCSMFVHLQIYHPCLRLRSLTATRSYEAKKDTEQFWHTRNGERNKTGYKFLIMPAAV
jgi:hypothetical protein